MTDEPNTDFFAKWAEDARLFASRPGEDNNAALTIIVADFEYSYDRDRHTGYRIAEGRAAEPKVRWPFHRIAASSWLTLRFTPGKTVPEIEDPVVLSARTMKEAHQIERFFDALRAEPQALLATWGGEAKDLSAVRTAAMMHDLVLPSQVADLHPHSRHRLDLCQTSSVAAPSVHLPELAAALGIPSKPSASKDIGALVAGAEWARVEDQVLADVVTAAILTIYQLAILGQVTCERAATLMALSDRLKHACPNSAFCTRDLAPWARARHAEAGLRGTIFRAPSTTLPVAPMHQSKQIEGELA